MLRSLRVHREGPSLTEINFVSRPSHICGYAKWKTKRATRMASSWQNVTMEAAEWQRLAPELLYQII